jgi:hypothetical protein
MNRKCLLAHLSKVEDILKDIGEGYFVQIDEQTLLILMKALRQAKKKA